MSNLPRIRYILLLGLTLVSMVARGDAGTVEQLLAAFDRSPQAATANAFFQQLDREEFTESPIRFAATVPVDSMRQQVWYWAAEWHYGHSAYEKARQYAMKALPLYHSDSEGKADCLNLLGCIFVRQGDFNRAATYAKQCLNIDLASGDHDRISSSMNTLAGIYMSAKQNSEAEHWILQAIGHAEKANNPARKAVLLGMASEVYHAMTHEEQALDYAEQALALEKQLGRPLHAAIRMDQKASALMGLKRYEEAEQTLREAIPVLREQGELHSLAIASNHLGTCLIWQKREAEAAPYYREAAQLLSRMGDPVNELYAHRGLCLSLWETNPDSARAELNRFNEMKDSLYTHDAAEALARMNAEFGNDQLQQQMDRERMAHLRDIIIAVVALLALMVSGLWLMRRRQRAHQRRTAELLREIERLRLAHEEVKFSEHSEIDESSEVSKESEESDTALLQRIIACVNYHLAGGDMSVETIAAHLGMSVSTLRRRMQAVTGETPKAYIQAIQMDKARKMLDEGGAVADVAYACGFGETSSFTRTFKRVFGETPTQYRTRH